MTTQNKDTSKTCGCEIGISLFAEGVVVWLQGYEHARQHANELHRVLVQAVQDILCWLDRVFRQTLEESVVDASLLDKLEVLGQARQSLLDCLQVFHILKEKADFSWREVLSAKDGLQKAVAENNVELTPIFQELAKKLDNFSRSISDLVEITSTLKDVIVEEKERVMTLWNHDDDEQVG